MKEQIVTVQDRTAKKHKHSAGKGKNFIFFCGREGNKGADVQQALNKLKMTRRNSDWLVSFILQIYFFFFRFYNCSTFEWATSSLKAMSFRIRSAETEMAAAHWGVGLCLSMFLFIADFLAGG